MNITITLCSLLFCATAFSADVLKWRKGEDALEIDRSEATQKGSREGRKEGRMKGKKEGRQEGKKAGGQEGRQEGRKEHKQREGR